jgi:hypothetical protein
LPYQMPESPKRKNNYDCLWSIHLLFSFSVRVFATCEAITLYDY